jgi:hypothetical protein
VTDLQCQEDACGEGKQETLNPFCGWILALQPCRARLSATDLSLSQVINKTGLIRPALLALGGYCHVAAATPLAAVY